MYTNTFDARQRLVDLTTQAIEILEGLALGNVITGQDRAAMRQILHEAREVVYDAGYPGEQAWRAILHASVHVTTPNEDINLSTWADALEELRESLEPLGLTSGSAAEI
jgi:hypothetical protein